MMVDADTMAGRDMAGSDFILLIEQVTLQLDMLQQLMQQVRTIHAELIQLRRDVDAFRHELEQTRRPCAT